MSLLGEIHKVSGDIRRAVNTMAKQGITSLDGMPRGTRKIIGYVCNIHEEGELAGTVDVQEFNYDPAEYEVPGVGHHKGVLLSAIQNNTEGVLIVPMLYSEVVVVQNPLDGQEYILMYSHAQKIRLTTHTTEAEREKGVEIGVTEVEEFIEGEDGIEKDYDELEPTKNKTLTKYTSTSIIHQVTSPDDEEGLKEENTAARKTISVGDTKITIDGQNVNIETSGKVTFTIGGATFTQEDGKLTIKTDNCEINGSNVKVNGSQVTITGGTLTTSGISNTDLNGPFNAIKACPFSGAPHCGSIVTGT